MKASNTALTINQHYETANYYLTDEYVIINLEFDVNEHRCVDIGFDTELPLFYKKTDHILDIFHRGFDEIKFYLVHPMTSEHMISIIDWLNNSERSIGEVNIEAYTRPLFKLFMNTFQKPMQHFSVSWEDCGCKHAILKFSKVNLDQCNYSTTWFPIDLLMNIDSEEIYLKRINLSAEEMNLFLRSWQEGKTNRNLKRCEFELRYHCDWKEVLKGSGGQLMDPRTTKKRDYRYLNERSFPEWIHGGIHIKRRDGQIALINKFTYGTYEEDEEIPQDEIDYYLNEKEKWNPEDDDLTNLANSFKNRSFFRSERYESRWKIIVL